MRRRLIPLFSLLALALASPACTFSASQAKDVLDVAVAAATIAPPILTENAPMPTPVLPVLVDLTLSNFTTSDICSVVFYSVIGDLPLARHVWQSGEFDQLSTEPITISIVEGEYDVSAYACDESFLDSKERQMISSGASLIFGP